MLPFPPFLFGWHDDEDFEEEGNGIFSDVLILSNSGRYDVMAENLFVFNFLLLIQVPPKK